MAHFLLRMESITDSSLTMPFKTPHVEIEMRAIPFKNLREGGSGRFFRRHSIEFAINCFRYSVED